MTKKKPRKPSAETTETLLKAPAKMEEKEALTGQALGQLMHDRTT